MTIAVAMKAIYYAALAVCASSEIVVIVTAAFRLWAQ